MQANHSRSNYTKRLQKAGGQLLIESIGMDPWLPLPADQNSRYSDYCLSQKESSMFVEFQASSLGTYSKDKIWGCYPYVIRLVPKDFLDS